MKKAIISMLLLLFSNLTSASPSCDGILGEQRFPPLKLKNSIVCFVEDASDDTIGVQTVVYTVAQGKEPIKAKGGELPNDGGNHSGVIVDAFTLDVDHDGVDEVVVIQYVEVGHTQAPPNSSGKFFGVVVFNQIDNILHINERLRQWFGYGYSWDKSDTGITYKYPFTTKESVIRAVNSPLASLMVREEMIPVIVKQKSYLYSFPYLDARTKKYLIAGDKGTVDKGEAGLCRINYTGGKAPLQMWIMCDALEADTSR